MDLDRATQLLSEKRNAEAVELLLGVTETRPDSADAWRLLGDAFRRLHDYEKSVEAYRRAMDLSAGSPAAALSLADAYRRLGRYEDARRNAELALEGSPAPAHTLLAAIALGAGQPGESEKQARLGVEADATQIAPRLMLARALGEQKRYEEALATLAGAEELLGRSENANRPYPGLYLLRGDLLAASDRRGEAREAYRQEIAAFPKDPLAYAHLARVLNAVGRRAEAIKVVQEMIATAPEDPAIHRTAVQVLRTLREFKEADRVAAAAAQRFPDDPSIRKLADKAAKIEEEELQP